MLFKLKTVSSFVLVLNALFPSIVSSWETEEDKNGAVASESAVCSQIGIDLLKEGGNAADALVGTVLCVGVIGMYHSGYVLSIYGHLLFHA
jgi:gamma-glutamyltranspeptidase/glutathione hydrolase